MERINQQDNTSTTNPRNAFIASLLSLIFPGLGQIYNGQPKKGAIFFTLILLLPILFGSSGMTATFTGFVLVNGILIALRVFIIIDAILNARKQKQYVLKQYNKWYFLLLIAIAMLTIQMTIDVKSFLNIQAFNISSNANYPTLQLGDHIMVDTKAYKNTAPTYGDIVTFTAADQQTYVFRVVGLPNDEIEIINNTVILNGKPNKERFIEETLLDEIPMLTFESQLPNGRKHLIYKSKEANGNTLTSIEKGIVPTNSYFLLGDNRDFSMDSRYIGPINKNKITGQFVYSLRGKSGSNRMNLVLSYGENKL